MPAVKSKTRRCRQIPIEWGARQWLMLGLLALLCAASSGCAASRRPVPIDAPPRLNLTNQLRTGSGCLTLRGRLPEIDELSVGETLSQWVASEAHGACQTRRADELVNVIDTSNAAWDEYARRPHR